MVAANIHIMKIDHKKETIILSKLFIEEKPHSQNGYEEETNVKRLLYRYTKMKEEEEGERERGGEGDMG